MTDEHEHPTCERCRQPFTPDEWDDRHEGEHQPVHAHCCYLCEGGTPP